MLTCPSVLAGCATGELTDSKVAAYVAKYATKAAECTGTLDHRVTPADQLADLPIREHARRLIAECLRLSKLPGLEGLRLAAWAHMLGFRGHFSTKSRSYSITLGALRPWRITSSPSASRTRNAWRRVPGFSPWSRAMSRTDGSASPGASAPLAMASGASRPPAPIPSARQLGLAAGWERGGAR